jgi:hypothetical protein
MTGFREADQGNVEQSLVRVIDVNHDGLNDICLMQEGGITCWLNDAGRFVRAWAGPAWSLRDPISAGSLRFGDLNNNSFPDICRLGQEAVECVLGSETGFKLDPSQLIVGPA